MSIAENCAIMRQVQADQRRRLNARIDRQLAKRTDVVGALYRRGQEQAGVNRAERQEHRLTVENTSWKCWRAVCACGEWHGRSTASKHLAEQDADRERERLFKPLTAALTHSESAA